MKREQIKSLLEGLGVPEDKQKAFIDEVMKLNNETIQNEQAKLTAKEAELTKAQDQIKTLNATMESYGGKPDELKQQLADLQRRYDTDIAAEKKKYTDTVRTAAVKDALTSAGVLDADYLIYKHGGIDNFAFADDKPIGIDDILNPYRESNPSLFKTQETTKTGMRHEGGSAPNTTKADTGEFNSLFRKCFGN